MKKQEWNEGLNHMDPDLVEEFVERKDRLSKKKRRGRIWLRWGAVAACFCLVFGAVITVPLLREVAGVDPYHDQTSYVDPGTEQVKNTVLPRIPTISAGTQITGAQEVLFGNTDTGTNGNADIAFASFRINTVVEAKVIEVLPDTYYVPDLHYRYFVARLSVVDAIRGEGLPQEIYFRFPFYSADVLQGYDTFIFSLEQVGIENFMMINETQKEIAYFPHMFEVAYIPDLGYGSVIAFHDGTVDESFWDRVTALYGSGRMTKSLAKDQYGDYPVGFDTTLAEAKENINTMIQNGDVITSSGDYVTAEDVFITEPSQVIRELVAPSPSNVFMQEIVVRHDEDRVIASYTRVINGFLTNEIIHINDFTGENGSFHFHDARFTEEELTKMPDIGEALAQLELREMEPPRLQSVEGKKLKYVQATGVYRKVSGKVYGIVRIIWYYTYSDPEGTYGIEGYLCDDCYYLYDAQGNGRIVDRDELRRVIGYDSIIAGFSYNSVLLPPAI